MLIGLGASGMAVGGLYAGGALTPGEVYPKPQAQVARELASMPVPPLASAISGSSAAIVEVRQSDDEVRWHFKVAGAEAAVFTATLAPEGKWKTRVRVSYEPKESVSPELDRLTSTALIRSSVEIAMREQVDARLESRQVDQGNMLYATGQHAANNPDQVREYGLAVGEMFKEVSNQLEANSALVRPSEPNPKMMMDKATRPSVVPPRD